MGDDKKSLQSLANAKSCCGLLPMSDPLFFGIYHSIGLNYLNNGQYKDALEHFEFIINYYKDNEHLFKIKLLIGYAHYGMKNYNKALQYFIEIKDNLWEIPGMNNQLLFMTYVEMGESYNCEDNTELATYYFYKAYELIDNIEQVDLEIFSTLILHFKNIKDYEKWKKILQVKSIVLDTCSAACKLELFIDWYLLYKVQKKNEEAEKHWDKVEKLLDIEQISLLPKKSIVTMMFSLQYMAAVYWKHKFDFFNAEKIYKTVESALDPKVQSHIQNLRNIFEDLLSIYMKQNKSEEINEYSQKYLKLLKLAEQNENFRQEMEYCNDDINELIRCVQESDLKGVFEIINSY